METLKQKVDKLKQNISELNKKQAKLRKLRDKLENQMLETIINDKIKDQKYFCSYNEYSKDYTYYKIISPKKDSFWVLEIEVCKKKYRTFEILPCIQQIYLSDIEKLKPISEKTFYSRTKIKMEEMNKIYKD